MFSRLTSPRIHFAAWLIPAALISTLWLGAAPLAAQATAETEPSAAVADPKADFDTLQSRADSNPNFAASLKMMVRQFRNYDVGMQPDEAEILSMMGVERGGRSMEFPLDFQAAQQREEAMFRAQLAGQILVADLNGDWAITRKELVSTISPGDGRGISDLFIRGDKDENNILDLSELTAVLRESVEIRLRNGNRERALHVSQLIDLDEDGLLSREEVRRAWAAILTQAG